MVKLSEWWMCSLCSMWEGCPGLHAHQCLTNSETTVKTISSQSHVIQVNTTEMVMCREVVTAFGNGRRKSQTFLPFLRFILELVSPCVSQYRMGVLQPQHADPLSVGVD
jgi:hypothetical protein